MSSLEKSFFDLDGTITTNGGYGISEIKIPWWILSFIFFFYTPKINQEVVKLINSAKEEKKEIIIITARPEKLRKITEKYLQKNNVYFDKIFFTNPGPNSSSRKIDIILKNSPCTLFENNRETIKKAKENNISCFLI